MTAVAERATHFQSRDSIIQTIFLNAVSFSHSAQCHRQRQWQWQQPFVLYAVQSAKSSIT